jgi:hypothetical protein
MFGTAIKKLIDGVTTANSLQAVLTAVGVAILSLAVPAYTKSKMAGIGAAFLGLSLIIAPYVLPSPKLVAAGVAS